MVRCELRSEQGCCDRLKSIHECDSATDQGYRSVGIVSVRFRFRPVDRSRLGQLAAKHAEDHCGTRRLRSGGTLFNPAKFNSRLGVVWSKDNFTASSFVNYTDGVQDTVGHTKTASFTTFDTTLRYETGELGNVFSDLAFELSVQNLFGREPPLYTPTSATAARYDSTNYSAIGRFVSLSVSKHF